MTFPQGVIHTMSEAQHQPSPPGPRRSPILRTEWVQAWLRSRQIEPGHPAYVDVNDPTVIDPGDPRYVNPQASAVQAYEEAIRAEGQQPTQPEHVDDPAELRARLAQQPAYGAFMAPETDSEANDRLEAAWVTSRRRGDPDRHTALLEDVRQALPGVEVAIQPLSPEAAEDLRLDDARPYDELVITSAGPGRYTVPLDQPDFSLYFVHVNEHARRRRAPRDLSDRDLGGSRSPGPRTRQSRSEGGTGPSRRPARRRCCRTVSRTWDHSPQRDQRTRVSRNTSSGRLSNPPSLT